VPQVRGAEPFFAPPPPQVPQVVRAGTRIRTVVPATASSS